MKNQVEITKTELVNMLTEWKFGAQPASIQYITEAALTKEGKKTFGTVKKVANVHCMIGYNYQNSVNNQRAREEELKNFMAQPLWRGAGSRVSTALATHNTKGTFYLTYKKVNTMKSFYFDADGNMLTTEELKSYFKPVYKPTNQGIEKVVNHREVGIDNVLKVKFRKTTYVIKG